MIILQSAVPLASRDAVTVCPIKWCCPRASAFNGAP
jgi:hypothetical protein